MTDVVDDNSFTNWQIAYLAGWALSFLFFVGGFMAADKNLRRLYRFNLYASDALMLGGKIFVLIVVFGLLCVAWPLVDAICLIPVMYWLAMRWGPLSEALAPSQRHEDSDDDDDEEEEDEDEREKKDARRRKADAREAKKSRKERKR